MKTIKVYLDGIDVGDRLRDADPEKVAVLAESMARIGLQQPISVWMDHDENGLADVHLVAGLHRVRAAEKLGWEQIDAIAVDLNEIDRRLWEIAENLHRAELTTLQRDEHVAEWIRLTEAQEAVSAQVEPKLSQRGRKGEGRPASGVRAASRELGIEKEDARRAVKVAALSEEAKEVAREVHLDDNRSALLKAAAHPEPEKQVEELRSIAEEKVSKKLEPKPAEIEEEESDKWSYEQQLAYDALVDAWESAPESARWDFLRWLPVKYTGSIAA